MNRRLRIALLDHAFAPGGVAEQLALALHAAGQEPVVLTLPAAAPRTGPLASVALHSPPDLPLRLRKIGDHLAHLPAAWATLVRGGFGVAHAFTPTDALAAIAWARAAGRPAVFTGTHPPERESIAGRRLRLATLRCAVEQSGSVMASSPIVADGLRRWMAIDAQVVAPGDAAHHLAIYRRLIDEPAGAAARRREGTAQVK